MSSYDDGTPSWVDLTTPDLEATKTFYGGLFGWDAQTMDDPAAGSYTMFTLRGKRVAACAPPQGAGQPSAWMTYVAVTDADAVAARVTAAGGTVLAAPFDVLAAGRMGVFADPEGAVVSVWQAGQHTGAELANEAGAFAWNELWTRDSARAKEFYTSVFGWSTKKSDVEGMDYTELQVGGRSVAGMMPMPAGVPDAVPANWVVYFGVADCDEAVASAQRLGGSLVAGPMDVAGVGRFATLAGPQGETFAVITMSG